MFRSRSYAWIVRGRGLADKVVRACNWCLGKTKQLLRQQISDLPDERTSFPCKPWTCTSIDLLGAYEVRAMNNARSKLCTYPIVFCCLNTGALHVELAHTYSTDAFLTCYKSFTSIRGTPAAVYSDWGTQLTKPLNMSPKRLLTTGTGIVLLKHPTVNSLLNS